MAMAGILKKIIFSPQTRCCLGGVQRIHLSSTGNLDVLWKAKKNEKEKLRSDLPLFLMEGFWVKSIHEVLYRNKRRQKRGDHRLLLSMKILSPDDTYYYYGSRSLRGRIIVFQTASPHTGLLVTTNKLLVDRVPYALPRQTVNGLVCITTHDAFLVYNPVTGDVSDWIELPTKNRCRNKTIALGYSPKSDKYKVICISESTSEKPAWVIEVMTLGENSTWRRIDAAQMKQVCPNQSRTEGAKEEFIHGPIYVNGFIHWRVRIDRGVEDIMRFNVETEEFGYLGIQNLKCHEVFG